MGTASLIQGDIGTSRLVLDLPGILRQEFCASLWTFPRYSLKQSKIAGNGCYYEVASRFTRKLIAAGWGQLSTVRTHVVLSSCIWQRDLCHNEARQQKELQWIHIIQIKVGREWTRWKTKNKSVLVWSLAEVSLRVNSWDSLDIHVSWLGLSAKKHSIYQI